MTLTDVDVADGVTLHRHGVDVPNAEDGVAGVMRDAVRPGAARLPPPGRGRRHRWSHSHQGSHVQVRGGPFEPADADRRFSDDIGRRSASPTVGPASGGRCTAASSRHPDVRRREGDVVRMAVTNHSEEVHPMHLHGHHAAVLPRDGVPAGGSPWWIDSLHVEDDESYEIAFAADDPGIWTAHCHDLEHARDGPVLFLTYAGVTEPIMVGGDADDEPE